MTRALYIVLLVACGGDHGPRWRGAGATEPRVGGTVRIAINGGITTLDPAITYDESSFIALHPIVEGLVRYARDSAEIEPGLAERWEIAADGLAYMFHLRPNLRYADGSPIVAADFKRALERVMKQESSPYGSHLTGLVGAQDVIDKKATDCTGIEALDDRTLRIRLTAITPTLLFELAMPYAAPITAEYLARPEYLRRTAPLSSGPYELVEWDEGRRFEVRARSGYHDKARQRISTFAILENVPRDLQLMMLERGELEAAERLNASDLRWIQSQPAWAPYLHALPLNALFGVRMNTQQKPFDDRRVRQALNYAVDKQRIVKLLTGTAIPAHGMLRPGAFGHDASLAPYPHDPEKARALLREAGYPSGFSLTYVTLNDEEAEKVAVSLKHDLAQIGVTIEISLVTPSAHLEALTKRTGAAFMLVPWFGDTPDPTSMFDPVFHSRAIADEGSMNFSVYKNAELDGILDAAKSELDRDKRAALYRRVERILYDDAPLIWAYHQQFVELTQPYVRDYRPHPIWLRDYTTAWLDLGSDGKPVRQ